MAFLTRGYNLRVEDVVGEGVFAEKHENMVMVRDIELYSMCEHHMLPFFGKAHIAYIPNGKIVGLSKLPRNVRLAEAPSHGLSILQYDIKSRGAEAYLAVARELLRRTK